MIPDDPAAGLGAVESAWDGGGLPWDPAHMPARDGDFPRSDWGLIDDEDPSPAAGAASWDPDVTAGIGDLAGDAAHWHRSHSEDRAIVAQGSIIQDLTGQPFDGTALQDHAVARADADLDGGTPPAAVGQLIANAGIPTQRSRDASVMDIWDALEAGDKVMVGLDAHEIWDPGADPDTGAPLERPDGGQAVWVTGMQQSPGGSIQVVLNDSAHDGGRRGAVVELADFMKAWYDFANLLVVARFRPPRPRDDRAAQGRSMMLPTRSMVEAAAAAFAPKHSAGIAGLVADVHRNPETREFVTLESVVLPPVPTPRGDRWELVSLLAVPLDSSSTQLGPAWGAVAWEWPGGKVLKRIDLRADVRLRAARAGTAGQWDAPAPGGRHLLCDRLDAALQLPDPDLAELAALYSSALPLGAYALYGELVPSARSWLRPGQPPAGAVGSRTVDLTPTSIPRDLTESVHQWIRSARKLARDAHLDVVEHDLAMLGARLGRPTFRVTVVGEFNRGKSHLINGLLGRAVLPEADLPSRTGVVLIRPGGRERLEISRPDGSSEIKLVDDGAWDRVVTDVDGGDATSSIRVYVNDPWLRDLGAEIIETPGLNDRSGVGLRQVRDVLAVSDAVLMTVSAQSPLSVTERTFLEDEVLGRNAPNVTVVVSMLDRIGEDDRADALLEVVTRRVQEVAPTVAVVPGVGAGPASALPSPRVAELRELIAESAKRSDRRMWRARQAAAHVADHLLALRGASAAEVALQSASEAEQRQEAQRRRASIASQARQREQLAVELETRRGRVSRLLEEQLLHARERMVRDLGHELGRTSDPKAWWEHELPTRLRREVISTARSVEGSLLQAVATDMAWLDAQMAERFGDDRPSSRPQPNGQFDAWAAVDAPAAADLDDVRTLRLVTRVGAAAATIGAFLIAGHLGIRPRLLTGPATLMAALAGEERIQRLTRQQRDALRRELSRTIDDAVDGYVRSVDDRVGSLYGSVLADLRSRRSGWQIAQLAGIGSGSRTQGVDWAQLAARADGLLDQIREATEPGGPR